VPFWSRAGVVDATTPVAHQLRRRAGLAALGSVARRSHEDAIFIATFGTLLGSLVGRVVADPHWQGHLLFVAAGAFLLSIVDRYRSKSVP